MPTSPVTFVVIVARHDDGRLLPMILRDEPDGGGISGHLTLFEATRIAKAVEEIPTGPGYGPE